ncbi:tetratricopeptide repeat protein [Niveibacterium umoris]|uniref:Peptidoglycan/xylan/chitin deacetylase (PgdA/CDA1 family)/uncharacterized caspase-like protein n=1 Tax=Niveibacterium umoris TaxID=1193620 RepID=A0A840BSF1_9RHOO|nr:polysaccharide deacetylase family protein [Niveibacterium umoris]MBB4014602.1 peptidoglycan/xylan/chitin deacetylase (PgdA/CDA1 family)/uncharacterized caspase-like protein [Niveibacterium umoris]
MRLVPAILPTLLLCTGLLAGCKPNTASNTAATATSAPSAGTVAAEDLLPGAQLLLERYRKLIVLLADERAMSDTERAAANQVGQALFHENLADRAKLEARIAALTTSAQERRFETFEALLAQVESGKGLFDADRLAYRELLKALELSLQQDSTLPAIKLHKRVGEDLDAMQEIEHQYDKELRQVFDRFETRAITLKREKWDDYVAHLKKLYSREQIMKDYGQIVPYPAAKAGDDDQEKPVFGYDLPPKTLVLTFDDGPHNAYTDEIAAILKQYNAPAVFFEVGNNLGSVNDSGKAQLGARANVAKRLKDAGYVLANHSYSHAQLSKETGDPLKAEINRTDQLLKVVDPSPSHLFRFPYGASSREAMNELAALKLRSIMWNIDSLDWADPVPNSIADRVLKSVAKEGRGIILFHDIHERTVTALPKILEQLTAEGYRFAGWDGKGFSASTAAPSPAEDKTTVTTGYEDSWAVVVGIDNYAKWPKLQYAARDADAIRQALIDEFGFASERVFSLKNGEATRNAILSTFHDRLAHGGVKKNDRIFVFFAGHGATRKLSSGRDLGYIIPVDSDPAQMASDAIPMTEIQNIAESLTAKHVLFVMDACYSGLGLTRGGGNNAFLKENARRIGRQMLTAGGADQLVADGGPNGHSVFTWTLLQGLAGKADLNGDGFITGTELAAYIAPAVASISQQTPAFGSLPGSQGGEFVFQLKPETEFLSPATEQLPREALALNQKLAEATPAASSAPVTVKDLQGNETKLAVPKPVAANARQLAQRANDRGLQLYREQQYAAAEAQFTEALKQRPDFALAANNLGFIYLKQQKYKEAARWFENTIKMDPSRAVAYRNLGDACIQSGEKDCARKAFGTYLELVPSGSGADYAKQQIDRL